VSDRLQLFLELWLPIVTAVKQDTGELPVKTMLDDLDTVEVKTRDQLRKWLMANHKQKQSVWLVTYKKAVPEFYLSYSDLVDECLCFGWIDSLPRKVDEQRTKHLISPRNPKSNWSKVNRTKALALIESGRMHKSGLCRITEAKASGTWTALESVENLELPLDLVKELRLLPPAWENFGRFPPSVKRGILEWIQNAKTIETRVRRCHLTAQSAQKNERVLGAKRK
jgi:uncharacterized protein YdeI (YjbR/CyaY-like superfamily)